MAIKCPRCQFGNPDDTLYCGKCASPLKSAEGISESETKTLQTPALDLTKIRNFAGRYNIIEELGRGGMGVVFKAHDTKLNRKVALKFLPPELTYTSEIRERFMREAQAAAALDHPNICTIHEFDEAEEKIFISMAYIKGQSLKKKVESNPLEIDDVLRLAVQIAEGLQEAHKKGVVHRDIKSGNIMVDERGQVKIMDFGLARLSGSTLVTKEGTTMGTIAYMSPEQARGEKVDFRTDIWSFGVVLYELLTGQLPFKGEHDQGVVYSILNEQPDSIIDLRHEIPMSLEQVVGKALEKNPDKRYQSMHEVLDDLRSISEGIEPEGLKVRLRRARFSRRKKIIKAVGAVAILIIIFVIAINILTGPAEAIDSIAILPLQNLTGDSGQEYFVDGVTDELIGQLAQIGALRVVSRTSAMQYKEADKLLAEIARELKVDVVVEGAVFNVGDKVRLRVQLIEVLPEERNLWVQTFDRPISEVLMMYSEIARAIVERIQIKLTPQEEQLFASAQQVDPEAYEAYRKGQFHWYKLTQQDLEIALQYFELVLEKDPNYSLAHAGVANVWGARQTQGLISHSEAVPKVKAAIDKALEGGSSQAEVQFSAANWKAWVEWDWKGADEAFQRAIELNPNYPDPRAYYSHLLHAMKRPEEAMIQIERALELDPLNPLFRALYGMDLMYAHRYDDAITLLCETLKTAPEDPVALATLRSAYHQKGMYEEAYDIWKKTYSAKGDKEAEDALIRGYKEGGYRLALQRVAELFEARSQTTYVTSWQIGTLYTRAGMKDKALEWLEKACDEHDNNMPYISIDPIFDDFRSDPRYRDLIHRLNLPE